MKKLAFLCLRIGLFFLLPVLLKGQDYQPMAVEGAHWIIAHNLAAAPWLEEMFSLTIRGDTIIKITLVDLRGKIYEIIRVDRYYDELEINLNEKYSPGIYFVQLENRTGVRYRKKIVIN
jgi:hypothetical protein